MVQAVGKLVGRLLKLSREDATGPGGQHQGLREDNRLENAEDKKISTCGTA